MYKMFTIPNVAQWPLSCYPGEPATAEHMLAIRINIGQITDV